MRAKTLLIATAALAAGVISSEAQVYSQNIVGYINLPLSQGYTLVGNQLSADTTGTNNSVATVFGTNLLAGTAVLAWQPAIAGYTSASWINSKGTFKWTGDTNGISAALEAGQGVFVQSPSATTLTVVGNVIQGTNIVALSAGYNLLSPVAPIAGDLVTNLNYIPTAGDQVLAWDPVAQGYNSYSYINSKGTLKWTPSSPQVSVGQSVFINTTAPKGWTNTFTAQ